MTQAAISTDNPTQKVAKIKRAAINAAEGVLTRRYTFKLMKLTVTQGAELHRQRRMHGELWNALLQRCEDTYRRWLQNPHPGKDGVVPQKYLNNFAMHKEITLLRRECPEWAALSSGSLARTANSLDQAFAAYFRRRKEYAANPAKLAADMAAFFARRGFPTSFDRLSGRPQYGRSEDHPSIPFRDGQGWSVWQSRGKRWKARFMGVSGEILLGGRFPSVPEEIRTCEVMFREGAWWLSVAVETSEGRKAGDTNTVVRFDKFIPETSGIDEAHAWPRDEESSEASAQNARILLGVLECPRGHPSDAGLTQECRADADVLQTYRDLHFKRHSRNYKLYSKKIARLKAKDARRRKEAAHLWTSAVVAQSSDITVIAPPSFKDATASGKGHDRDKGACVATIAALNRTILDRAPAMTIAMLEYKAKHAKIRFDRVDAQVAEVTEARDIASTKKVVRKSSRAVKKKERDSKLRAQTNSSEKSE